jgi:DNA-binding CsgD family transcriptional regulator
MMSVALADQAWHRTIGNLIDKLKRPEFWDFLIRVLSRYADIDNWVVFVFSDTQVQTICYPSSANDDEVEAFLNDYVKGFYILDPFYIANRESLSSGFFHLNDIAPTHFFETEYYDQYFRKYVSADEIQYNVKLDKEKTLCLSIGSKTQYSVEQISTFRLIEPWLIALMYKRMDFEASFEENSINYQWQDTIVELAPKLTTREVEVVKLALSGFSNNEIAGRISVSMETVKVHRRNIYSKLNIKSQSALFAFFFKSGIE